MDSLPRMPPVNKRANIQLEQQQEVVVGEVEEHSQQSTFVEERIAWAVHTRERTAQQEHMVVVASVVQVRTLREESSSVEV